MGEVFGIVLNMSIRASVAIVIVLILRLVFGKISRNFSFLLWLPVLFRLLCPFAWESNLSPVPQVNLFLIGEEREQDILKESAERNGVPELSETITGVIKKSDDRSAITHEGVKSEPLSEMGAHTYEKTDEGAFVKIPEKTGRILGLLWIVGMCIVLFCEGSGYVRFVARLKDKKEIKNCDTPIKNMRIFTIEQLKEPFVLGIVRPVIYLPEALDKEKREIVLLHEHMHIKRLDYVLKPLWLFGCCIHWFNPLVWLSFYLMVCDMESSCDELVLGKIGEDKKKEYAYTLLALSTKEGWRAGYPLAFGENNVKRRIKNVVEIKKKSVWLIGIAAFAAGAIFVLLLTDRPQTQKLPAEELIVQEQTRPLPSEEIIVKEEESKEEEKHVYEETVAHEYRESGSVVNVKEHEEAAVQKKEEMLEQMLEQLEAEEAELIKQQDKFAVLLIDSPEAYYDLGISYIYPIENAEIANAYGVREHPLTKEEHLHSGVDFVAEEGTPVLAAGDGTVAETGFESSCGNYVIVQHVNGEATYYACCQDILVSKGTEVKRGQQIATVGKTGASTGAHLHFAISKNGAFFEPVFE